MGASPSSPETLNSKPLAAVADADADADDDADADADAVADADPRAVSNTLFAIFREVQPAEERYDDPSVDSSMLGRAVDFIVANFQPSPVMAHVELVVPPPPHDKAAPMNFATYIGEHSRWECASDPNRAYYLFTKQNWRAVPVYGRRSAALGRAVCNRACDVPYSLTRYLTAAPGLRHATSWLMPTSWQQLRSPAQCATLVSRVILRTVGTGALRWCEAAYGPATLYAELLERVRDAPDGVAEGQTAALDRAHSAEHKVTFWIPEIVNESVAPPPPLELSNGGDGRENEAKVLRAQEAAHKLCHGSHDEVWSMSDEHAAEGVKFLADRVQLADGDAVHVQRELARALLTWCMCRPSRPTNI